LLRLLGPFLGQAGRRLRDEARDLARALAGARDAQSALDALGDLGKHGLKLSPRSLATLRGRIEEIRVAAESSILPPAMRVRLAGLLDRAAAAIARWPLEDLTFSDIADRLAGSFRAARQSLPDDWSEARPDELHELRKCIVNHRYQMAMVEPLWPRFGRMW